MSDDAQRPLEATGARVAVRPATHGDIPAYRDAMTRSAARVGRWNPVNPHDLAHHLAAQSERHRTFLVWADDSHRVERDGLVGCVNVTNVIQGRFMSATMGYNAFDPYVGTGMFREGLALVVTIALGAQPAGMGLHRVEANVRTGNATSAGVLRSLGFRRERTVRRMLWLADGVSGPSSWRDHDSYAVTREEWPAVPHAAHDAPAGVIVVGDDVSVPVVVAVARELGAVALFDVPFDAALEVAHRSAVPVLWHAGSRAAQAVEALAERGVQVAPDGGALRDVGLAPRSVTAAALTLRPLLT